LENYDVSPFITGTTRGKLTKSGASEIVLPLPPLSEQRRISGILDKAEVVRAKRRVALTKIEILPQAIFLKLFGDPKDNPKGWSPVRLMEVCSPKQWPTISSGQLLPDGYPVFGANGLIGHFREYNHESPTVLITCRGATCGTINVSPPKCYVTGNAMSLDNPDEQRITIEFLEWVLRLRGVANAISGTAQPQITRQNLHSVTFPLPPLELQREFARQVHVVEKMKTAQRASLAKLNTLFFSLQHRAFRGEL
jgi:type I restriction enzyme S subunit